MKTVQLARAGLMIAVVFVITRLLVFPIPQTKGFFNLGEAGIYAASVLFGPIIGALAGGLGSALADLSLGYTQYAPFTLIIKGLEGCVVGVLAGRAAQAWTRIAAMVAGGLVMVAGYFMTQAVVLGLGAVAALAEVPFNLVQVLVGVLAGTAAMAALRRALPTAGRS
jgi:uncharacterized membrane protein